MSRSQHYLSTLEQPRHSSIGRQEIRHRDPVQHRAVTLQRLVHAAGPVIRKESLATAVCQTAKREDRVDLAIRIGTLPDTSLIATRISAIRRIVWAALVILRSAARRRARASFLRTIASPSRG